MKDKTCLVTGGAGFIGSHLVDRLLAEGARVRVLDDLSTGTRKNLEHLAGNDRLTFIEGSITDATLVDEAMDSVTHVFHLAARASVPRSIQDPWGTHEANVNGTLRLLEKARQVRRLERFVFTSSSSVYGNTPTLPKSEPMAGMVLSPYALQKWTGETYARLYQELYGVPTISLRPFNIFGPRQRLDTMYGAVIPRFIAAAREGRPLVIQGDGLQTRDFTYVSNMVDAFLLAATTPNRNALGKSFNSGAGGRFSVLELARNVLELTGSRSPIQHDPPRPGDVRDSFADLALARRELGYEPKVDFRRGLELLVQEKG